MQWLDMRFQFPNKGLNPDHSSENTRSLTHCTARELCNSLGSLPEKEKPQKPPVTYSRSLVKTSSSVQTNIPGLHIELAPLSPSLGCFARSLVGGGSDGRPLSSLSCPLSLFPGCLAPVRLVRRRRAGRLPCQAGTWLLAVGSGHLGRCEH